MALPFRNLNDLEKALVFAINLKSIATYKNVFNIILNYIDKFSYIHMHTVK